MLTQKSSFKRVDTTTALCILISFRISVWIGACACQCVAAQTQFAAWLSFQSVTSEGLVSRRSHARRNHVVTVHGAPAELREALATEWSQCTPDEAHAKAKWKTTIPKAAFKVCSVGSLTVVIPWYRYCQMDRSSRWALKAKEGEWDNGKASGPFVDVPSAHMYAALLSADPPPPPGETDVPTPPLPPKQILIIDIHDDLNGRVARLSNPRP